MTLKSASPKYCYLYTHLEIIIPHYLKLFVEYKNINFFIKL